MSDGIRLGLCKLATLACVVTLSLFLVCRGDAAPASPTDVVSQFYGMLLKSMKSGPVLGAMGRYRMLEPVVRMAFDMPFMTRLAVGPTWAGLSSNEKRRASEAFARYITATYASEFADYSGERLNVLGEQKTDHGTIVKTRIVSGDGDSVTINYVLHDNDAAWQIRDVYLTGTISQLATRRSEFIGTLRSGGIEGLIARLNQKASDLQK